MQEDRFRPRGLHLIKFVPVLNCIFKETANRQDHGYESQQVTKWHRSGRVRVVGGVLLLRSVAKTDLELVIQPVPVMWSGSDINHPLHKTALDTRLVFF